MLQLDDLLSAAGACNGTRFHALALRALRLAECTSRLPCLLGLAHKGVPVPTHAEQLEPISGWLQSTSQAATDLTSSNCFTLEFSANGNQYQSTYIYIYIYILCIYLFVCLFHIYIYILYVYIYESPRHPLLFLQASHHRCLTRPHGGCLVGGDRAAPKGNLKGSFEGSIRVP